MMSESNMTHVTTKLKELAEEIENIISLDEAEDYTKRLLEQIKNLEEMKESVNWPKSK